MTKNGDLNFNRKSLGSAGDQDPKAGNKYETRPHLASRPSPILTCLVDSPSYLKAPLLLSFAPPANSYAETSSPSNGYQVISDK